MKIDFSGHSFLVTGASRGIGLAITTELLASGAKVFAHFNRSGSRLNTLEKKYPDKIVSVQADLENTHEIEKLFMEATSNGPVAGVVLNAGVALASAIEFDLKDWYSSWQRTMRINLDAPAILTKLFIDHFHHTGNGRLVYIVSRASHRGETMDYMAYGASKAGMSNLLKTVARNEGKKNIKAFGIAPGFTRTDMAQDFIDKYGEEVVVNDLALTDLTEPRDISPMVALLLSGKADHATGSIIDINAGSYVR